MWRNYLAAALHNLSRNRAYAAINILGLALGFAAVFLIALYVHDEYTWDSALPHADRTYRLSVLKTPSGAPSFYAGATTANVAAALKLEFPEVEVTARLTRGLRTLRQGDVEILPEYFHWADPDFFRMFPFAVVAGDIATALDRPDGLVLTRKMARQLFGRDDVIGRAVTLNRQQTVVVTAVIEDLPWNTHLKIDAVGSGLASFSAFADFAQIARNADLNQPEAAVTYVRLRPGASVEHLNAGMDRFVDRHYPNKTDSIRRSASIHYSLVSLPDLHFLPPSNGDLQRPGDRQTVRGMALIGVLILIVAAGSFVSMMTARAGQRALEVGVRKSVGALPRQIVVQFLAECLLLSGFALVVALFAAWLILPAFNALLDRGIGFNFVHDPLLAGSVVVLWVSVAFAAGIYPALMLSRYRPVSVLRGILSLPGGPGRLRQAMVALQFGTLMVLLVATITVERQTRFATEEQLRVPGEQVLVSPLSCAVSPGLRDIVASLPGVMAASCASEWDLNGRNMVVMSSDGSSVKLRAASVDVDHLRLLGIAPLVGRLHDRKHGEDMTLERGNDESQENPSIVINEAAARALGYANPADAVGQYRRWVRPGTSGPGPRQRPDPRPSRIIGVIPDFSLASIRERIAPTGYFVDPLMSISLYLKLDGARIPETLRAVEATYKTALGGVQFKRQFLNQVLADLYSDIRRQARLLAAFSAVALVVASLGLLGLAIFTAERRTHEIGVRKCMGASRADILRFLGWQFARPVLIAMVIAWPVAYFFMKRWLEGFAYHVDLGRTVFVLASVLALVIALVTVIGHAVMVSRARPAESLRYE